MEALFQGICDGVILFYTSDLWGQSTNFRWIRLLLLSPVCSFKNELAPTLKTKN